MSEGRYNREHLKPYQGILTSEVQNGSFKMALKVEDNDILKRSKEIGDSIELGFKYDYSYSSQFFHNIHLCQIEKCSECEEVRTRHYRFKTDLNSLQLGDTFEISAALINNRCSELPREIGNIKLYEPLLVACPDYYNQGSLRLPDTPEGIKRKYDLEQQRLQLKREAEERREVDEKQAQKDAKWRKRKEAIHQFFGKSPYITQIITSVIGGLISGLISGVFIATIVEPIPRLFRWIISLF